jgi:SAM-dependent methyltransferase
VPLPYYSRAADADFWSEHWGGHSVVELLEIARGSPLTELVERYLPRDGQVLEAGCGLGQYVLLLRERGRRIVGADWSFDAVKTGAAAGAPLAVMDLRALGVRTGGLRGYLSLGAAEHDPAGPDAIVAEAARVLAPGGALLLSVPYRNGLRRLGEPLLAWRARRLRAAGGQFYQFAFSRREVRAFVEAQGFRIVAFHPYDPARILRKALTRLTGRRGPRARGPAGPAAARPRSAWKAALRGLLYTGPPLAALGHMILVVAVRR